MSSIGRLLRLPSRLLPASRRLLSSSSLEPSGVAVVADGEGKERRAADRLERTLLNLKNFELSAVVPIVSWVGEGNSVNKHMLLRIVRRLRERRRYKHALEVCEWIASRSGFQLEAGDYAVHLDLIGKVRGTASAEKFFDDLSDQMKNQTTHTSLLHIYVQNNMLSKAESMFGRMAAGRFLTSCSPYNNMMNLYLKNGLLDKVPKMMEQLEKNGLLPDVVSYNILLTACSTSNDLEGAERIFVEMHEKQISPDWITHSILVKLYISNGMPGKARKSLKEMEEAVSKESHKGPLAYCSVLSHYANLSDKDDVERIWDVMKSKLKRIVDPEYSCMIRCLVKVGDLEQAERIYSVWESVSANKEAKIPNILLSGYVQNDMMEKAETFIVKIEGKKIRSNYTTWEIMVYGYLGQDKIGKALQCLKRAFQSLKKWKPNVKIVQSVFDKLERSGDTESADQFLSMLREAGFVTTPIYNSFLRTYKRAGKTPLLFLERMKKDKVKPDDETRALLEIGQ